jgi:hypothetical protein
MTMDVALFVADAALVKSTSRGPTTVLAHDWLIVSVGDPDHVRADPRAAGARVVKPRLTSHFPLHGARRR